MTDRMRAAVRARPWLFPLGPTVLTAAALLSCIGVCSGYPCFSTGVRYGLWLDQCPATDVRLVASLDASGLLRGDKGRVSIAPQARFLDGDDANARPVNHGFSRGVSAELQLLDADDQPMEGMIVHSWKRQGRSIAAEVTLPADLPDGDYQLAADVITGFETARITAPLPLYAPAIVHVMTDRPLYRPGQDVQLRSVMLQRTDESPLDGRPGRWTIHAPDGAEMLVERAKAGAFGVAATTFPLDSRAPVGTWKATWRSGKNSDTVTFEVRPFRLPRFTVEVGATERFYRIGDMVAVEGKATYTSGAPVANAPLQLTVRRASGRWPMPLAWEKTRVGKTDVNGNYRIEIGRVPADLVDRVALSASVRVTEEAGEVADGGTQLVLSKDGLHVETVTELGDGLVGGFNNRAYIRVSTPDGRPLRDADVRVSNPWDEAAPVRKAKTDADGVAALQLDPGDPVTVVIPPAPVRVRPLTPDAPAISSGNQMLTGSSLSLAERRSLDGVHAAIAACGDFTKGNTNVALGVRVSPAGLVRDAWTSTSAPLGPCVEQATKRVRFPAGIERTYKLTWYVPDSLRPSLTVSTDAAMGSANAVDAVIERQARAARRCLKRNTGIDNATVLQGHWIVADTRRVNMQLSPSSGTGLGASDIACIKRFVDQVVLEEPYEGRGMGTVRIALDVPRAPGTSKPQATTKTGYELKVSATSDGTRIGDTRVILDVGRIPALRLRATPTLAAAGERVTIDLLRGPDFRGELPKKLRLMAGSKKLDEVDVDRKEKKVSFTMPFDYDGFVHVEHAGARAVVYVKPSAPLAVSLKTDQATYRPGDVAKLTVTTTAGGAPTAAGVGLSGVDSTLAQLAPLLGPDEWGRVTVRAKSDKPAFGAFDPKALVLGQLQGENAAKAAVMRITHLPNDPAGDERVGTSGRVEPNEVEILTDNFYRALEQLVGKVRAWEGTAPEGTIMDPPKMAKMWKEVLTEQKKAGTPVVDAYGRQLDLKVLPSDLLVQVDPRKVVADATHLPEDVVDWERWVREAR